MFSATRALWWKEYRQNRWAWILFLLLSVSLTFKQDPSAQRTETTWSDQLSAMITGEYHSLYGYILPLHQSALLAALLWGVWLMAAERFPNTYSFLASFPVNRTQIFHSKFFFGVLVVLTAMTINLAGFLLLKLVLPVKYTAYEALGWFLYCTPLLIALFSLGFFAASWTGNVISGAGAALALSVAPVVLETVIAELFYRNPVAMALPSLLTDRLFLYSYLWRYIQEAQWWDPLFLLLFSVILFRISRALFLRNAMERNGQILQWGFTRH